MSCDYVFVCDFDGFQAWLIRFLLESADDLLRVRRIASWAYYAARVEVERGDFARALLDITSVVELPDVPLELKVNALFNRGATYCQLGETEKALADYTSVVEMPDAPVDLKAKALLHRG